MKSTATETQMLEWRQMETIQIDGRAFEVVQRIPVEQITKHESVLALYRAKNIAAKLELRAVVSGFMFEAFEHSPDENNLVRHTALGRKG